MIIEDDPGETEPEEEVVPYQLSKEAIVLDMKVQDIKVINTLLYFTHELLCQLSLGIYVKDNSSTHNYYAHDLMYKPHACYT